MIRGTIKRKLSLLVERIEVHAAYKRLFDTPDGKAVLRDVLRQGYVTRSTFVAGDQQQTALNEGSRRLALSILKYVHKDHAAMVRAIEEGVQEDNE